MFSAKPSWASHRLGLLLFPSTISGQSHSAAQDQVLPPRRDFARQRRRRLSCRMQLVEALPQQTASSHGGPKVPLVVVGPDGRYSSSSSSSSNGSTSIKSRSSSSSSSSSPLESESRRQLRRLLGLLQSQGDLSTHQVVLAKELAIQLDLEHIAPDVVAAALLVVLARVEGRVVCAAAAARAVRRACPGPGIYGALLGQVRQLEATWQASQRWQRLLGPPVSQGSLIAQQAQRILLRLAAAGAPKGAEWALAAAQAAGSIEAGPTETPGNLAGGLLLLVSETARGRGGRAALGPRTALRAIRAAGGGEASQTGILCSSRRLSRWREVLGLPPAPQPQPPAELQAQRAQQLEALLCALAAAGELAEQDVPLLLQLAGSLPGVAWPAGTLAAALLVLLGRARGGRAQPAAAAAAVQRAGGEASCSLAFHLSLLQQHWQICAVWQDLLGPPVDSEQLARERLAALLLRLSQRGGGSLRPGQLNAALALAGDLGAGELSVRVVGATAGALLVLLAAARGERLARQRAVAEVQSAGGAASAQGVASALARLQRHWEGSDTWRGLLGDPPSTAALDSRPASLGELLACLEEAGHLPSGLAPAAEALASKFGLGPVSHGNLAACLLVLASEASSKQHRQGGGGQGVEGQRREQRQGQQRGLTVAGAVATTRAAGGSASGGSAGRLLRRLSSSWEAGDADLQALLGPAQRSMHSSGQAKAQLGAVLQQLVEAGALTQGQLPRASQLSFDLAGAGPQRWHAGGAVGAVLIVLAAAEGGRGLLPAEAAAALRAVGVETSAKDVLRHKAPAWRLWQSREDWQTLLGSPPAPPCPSRTTVCGLLKCLANHGILPPAQLQPATALARGLRVPRSRAPATAVAIAVGWAEATGQRPCVEGAVATAAVAGCAADAADVQQQLRKLQEKWGPPCAWAQALQHPPSAAAALQCRQQLAALLQRLEGSGHLRPGQAAKAQFLAQLLQVWAGPGPAPRPGNVAGALAVVVARAGGWSKLTSGGAVAAVRAAGAAAAAGSVAKWRCKCMRQWRESQDWQAVLGAPPEKNSRSGAELATEGGFA